MATYRATDYIASEVGHGLGGTMKVIYREVTATAALTTDDVLQFGYAPKGFLVLGGIIEASDLDTSGSPAITLNVGDAGSAARLWSAATVGQAATSAAMTAVTGVLYEYTEDTLITGAVATGPGTGASGTIRIAVYGLLRDSATS